MYKFKKGDIVKVLNHGNWKHCSKGEVIKILFTLMGSQINKVKLRMYNGVEVIIESYYLRVANEN